MCFHLISLHLPITCNFLLPRPGNRCVTVTQEFWVSLALYWRITCCLEYVHSSSSSKTKARSPHSFSYPWLLLCNHNGEVVHTGLQRWHWFPFNIIQIQHVQLLIQNTWLAKIHSIHAWRVLISIDSIRYFYPNLSEVFQYTMNTGIQHVED